MSGRSRGSQSTTTLAERYAILFPFLDEKQRRLVVGSDVLAFKLSVSEVSVASGLTRTCVATGAAEFLNPEKVEKTRTRRSGGGRKSLEETQSGLIEKLEELISPHTKGDPMSLLLWTAKSTRNLANALTKVGYQISHTKVAHLLHKLGYSLKGNVKEIEGTEHPDRNAQFEFIARLSKWFAHRGNPVISVDTKKKELVGEYRNGGREWSAKGEPTRVNVHDFIDPAVPRAVPYGVYDLADDSGFVNVGIDNDTAEFAVESIRLWFKKMGKVRYPNAKKLLICADGGGSNGSRLRLWKTELQKLANEIGIEISVSHFPPGTSKRNKIEHRLFSFISMNWRGRPLTTYKVIIDLIGATRTRSGLTVKSHLDRRKYAKGREVHKSEMDSVNIKFTRHRHQWNYTIRPNN